jgi:hypothetical protein
MKRKEIEISHLAYEKIVEPLLKDEKWRFGVYSANDIYSIRGDELEFKLLRSKMLEEVEHLNHLISAIDNAKESV